MRPVCYAHRKVALDADLACKTEAICEFIPPERCILCGCRGRRRSLQHFDAATCASCDAAAAVKHVDTVIFEAQYELGAERRLERSFTLDCDDRHRRYSERFRNTESHSTPVRTESCQIYLKSL
jgi:hypothetical protein